MVRFLIRTGVMLGANALGLWIASLLLDDMSINAGSFILALLIFTGVELVVTPLLTKQSERGVQVLQGGTAVIATIVGLIVTDVISDGLSIDGVGTFLLAALIVWLAAAVAGMVLGMLFLKNRREERKA